MFKEFKSTATWLQFPFLCGAAKDSVYENTSRSARHGTFAESIKFREQRWSPPDPAVPVAGQYLCLCNPGLVGPAPTSVRWTCLMMDLRFTLSVYLNRRYSHLKSIRLCANMVVKNMFTSDLLLDPGENQIQYTDFKEKVKEPLLSVSMEEVRVA
ncbi:hypothetical protein XENOCAPTIV_001922 [Xenoophorus captivus]|uniref:CFA20 domain-containing protein n=1 Tax=Xenoophorus captivus TaxID=1517983 RepID=A0ABV0S243_9TELE